MPNILNLAMIMKLFRENRALLIVVVFFAAVYALISVVNHYYFRTYALDLGAYTNAIWDYAHFQWNDSMAFKAAAENLLADHFDLYLLTFSPFSWIFGTYTLLILQICFVLFGGIGVYRYFQLSDKTSSYALYASIYYYLFFGLISALSFDYHSNTVAATLVPWLFYFVKREKVIASSLMLLALLVAKENISLWVSFICLGLMIEMWRRPFWRYYMASASVFSILYFMLITSWVMPALANQHAYPHFHYSILGSKPAEAIMYMLAHPLDSIQAFFINHTGNPDGNYVKLEFLILLIVSGAYILFRKPAYIIMLIPLFFQKFYHDNIGMWGISSHYSVEFAPILAIGIFSSIASFRPSALRKILIILSLGGCLLATLRIMDRTVMHTDKSRIRIYQASHYKKDYDVRKAHQALKIIPDDAVVCAQSSFLPHLSLRDHIYQFPMVKDAEYIVISSKENPYPLTQEAFDLTIDEIMTSGQWEQLYGDDGLYILKRSPIFSIPHPSP